MPDTRSHWNSPDSAGNDIVALDATDKDRTSEYRFYSRILSPGEKRLADRRPWNNLPFDHYVWLLWSIKESAYKYRQRIEPALVFSPLKMTVSHLEPPSADHFYKGIVLNGRFQLYFRSLILDKMIMTIVSASSDFENTRWGYRVIGASDYASQSASVRKYALEDLATRIPGFRSKPGLGDPPRIGDPLRIEKAEGGFPVILFNQKKLRIPISLSHHGHFVGWSYSLPAPLPAIFFSLAR